MLNTTQYITDLVDVYIPDWNSLDKESQKKIQKFINDFAKATEKYILTAAITEEDLTSIFLYSLPYSAPSPGTATTAGDALDELYGFIDTIESELNNYVLKAGDTMTGYLILNADPVNNLGAATKQYVDNFDITTKVRNATIFSGFAAGSNTSIVAGDTVYQAFTKVQGQINARVSSVGTLDSQSKSANGGVITSGVLYYQTADSTYPGLVSTGTQTFAGSKTFSSTPTFATMTSGSVFFGGTGGLLKENNSNLFWDDSLLQLIIGGNTSIGASSSTSSKLYIATTTPSVSTLGLVSLGSASFGAGGTFSGSASGTVIAVNTSSSRDLINYQINGAKTFNVTGTGSIFLGDTSDNFAVWAKYQKSGGIVWHGSSDVQNAFTIQFGNLTTAYFIQSGGQVVVGNGTTTVSYHYINKAPDGNANYALVNYGNKPFDGSSSGFYVGSGNGTFIGINSSSTNPFFADWQVSGVSKFSFSGTGDLIAAGYIQSGTIQGGIASGGSITIISTTHGTKGQINIDGDLYPVTNDTFYLGKNSSSTPKAFKGVILKDTTNGNYYRIEIISGTITATVL